MTILKGSLARWAKKNLKSEDEYKEWLEKLNRDASLVRDTGCSCSACYPYKDRVKEK